LVLLLVWLCTTLPAAAIVSPARVFRASDCTTRHMPLPAAAIALRTTVPTLALAHQPTLAVQRHAPHRSTIDWSSPAVLSSSTHRPMAWLLLLRRTVSSGAVWVQSTIALPLRSCLTRTSDGVIRRAKSCVCTCTVQAWGYACTCTCHLHATRRRRRAASSPAILSLASTVGGEVLVVKSSSAAKSSRVKSSGVKSSQVTVGSALQHAPGGAGDLWESCLDVAPEQATFGILQQGTPRRGRGRRMGRWQQRSRKRDGWEALDDGLF